MTKAWTAYRLTNPQLRILANLTAGNAHNHGMAGEALRRKGLVIDGAGRYPRRCCDITEEGREALADARREGW